MTIQYSSGFATVVIVIAPIRRFIGMMTVAIAIGCTGLSPEQLLTKSARNRSIKLTGEHRHDIAIDG